MKVEVHCSYRNRFFRISFVLTSNVRLIKLFNENIKMLEKKEKFEIKRLLENKQPALSRYFLCDISNGNFEFSNNIRSRFLFETNWQIVHVIGSIVNCLPGLPHSLDKRVNILRIKIEQSQILF